jgi:hypothetical protein
LRLADLNISCSGQLGMIATVALRLTYLMLAGGAGRILGDWRIAGP